ncbi:MAG TPA: GPR1/FUN34/YaaH family transporter [Baekduia sp.]|uniref:acetate uptake transporter family protein n=1 Tax=Baekduia sp. TaxID=2600305 RepID=UPI002D79A1E2|nr:GPR1/FUN34/YaaH family transporter [Baekduia sp.]HET6510022.1 GPR1/FUN34/YaaH family transporter [Baekduia sp.]
MVLQPIAAPSILGLFAFAAATFMVSTNMAHWYGTPTSGLYLFPFAAVFGGLAQLLAGMWSYRARDGVATAMHGMWGSFWIAYGILWLLDATGTIAIPAGKFPELGYWFLALGAITLAGTLAATFESLGLTSVLGLLAAGSVFAALHYLTGSGTWETIAGWVLFASALAAFYVATALMMESAAGRAILPLGKPSAKARAKAEADEPDGRVTEAIGWILGEPGIRHGQ